ncbi:MAG: hypothetical protein K0Q67_2895 [Cellvibrio sp.]|nr:hypothetical protein [Cellvibrio sp.]
MNTMVHPHPVKLRAPFYSSVQGAELHRYFEPEFTNLFQQDLQRHRIGSAGQNQWKQDDAFSGFDQRPVLRLPMHKSFYLVSCEIVCERPGKPALDPQQIASAGYVIRRLGAKGEQSWMLEDDQALGWQSTPTGVRDPDVNRRCCNLGLNGKAKVKLRGAAPAQPALTYTGEQTHPMHAIKSYDTQGKCHTVVYGYLSLGGTYLLRQPVGKSSKGQASPFTADSLNNFSQTAAAQLPWPFGFKLPGNQSTVNQTWTYDCARPINKALPSAAFFELLKHLVNRYHLGEANVADNAALQGWAEKQHFYLETVKNKLSPETFNDVTRTNFTSVASPGNLYTWLETHFAKNPNALVNYIAAQEQRLDENKSLELIPGLGSYSLYITPADAQELRTLLGQRVLDQVMGKVKEIPLPKFGQQREDIYQIIPFVRVRNACGGEEIVWGDMQARSEIFRVAAPFDPSASRPSLIQMPSLADLRKGMAQGVSMLTPPDTFSLLNALNLKKGASEEVVPKGDIPQLGIQWICSFSLPVITLVAMIVLMIMISLLNIIFFWLPWVRICLPFPSIKKE